MSDGEVHQPNPADMLPVTINTKHQKRNLARLIAPLFAKQNFSLISLF